MSDFKSIIEKMKNLSDISEKNSFLTVILNAFQNKRAKIAPKDKKELSAFALAEIKNLLTLIPTLETYQEKENTFRYEDNLLGIVMLCHASPSEISESDLNNIEMLTAMVEQNKFVENAVDCIFNDGRNDKAAVERLVEIVTPLKDEYQKGLVYRGLIHYDREIQKLPTDSKAVFSDYITSEFKRYLNTPLNDTIINNLEFACDAAKYFMNDSLAALLSDILKFGKNNINYYAVSSLLSTHQAVPADIIEALAKDLVYADGTYSLLKQHGLTELFPKEFSDPVYLAKSDLVHWLTYPTELGKEPDEIEYLGKVTKKEDYYLFRYTSDSDNLGDELKGRWLIGWSNDEGGTFSNFDLYSDFEKKTPEKTLKNIKKRLL
ncbi:MAG: hypothetical protein IKW18_05510 [Clostridia bacterium]|nr:hypothetical protein [Clostridia bacterium]